MPLSPDRLEQLALWWDEAWMALPMLGVAAAVWVAVWRAQRGWLRERDEPGPDTRGPGAG